MQLISNLAIVPILLIALGFVYPAARAIGVEAKPHRYSSIDGFRGFLALFVFIHHASIWFYLTHFHRWGYIPSPLFNQFGSTSVAFFFMITAFLFFSKLLEARAGKMDWLKLYVSRILRIMPLYLFAVTWLFILVGVVSGFTLKESFGNLVRHIGQWMLFMEPDINNLKGTKYLISGVQWSLAFEWLFYCSLAVIGAVFFRIKTTAATVIFACLGFILFLTVIDQYYPRMSWARISPFLAGVAAAFVARDPRARKLAAHVWVSPILAVLLYIALFLYPTVFSMVPYCCASLVFIVIACGNDFFGLLTLSASRLLGQISYSIYLLHGLLLYVTFTFVVGPEFAEKLSPLGYWSIIGGVCAVLVIFTCLTYYYIERPCLNKANSVTGWIRGVFTKPSIINHLPDYQSDGHGPAQKTSDRTSNARSAASGLSPDVNTH
jgi:peptidoglycan/LPS O-acetylase OafA/YrhL